MNNIENEQERRYSNVNFNNNGIFQDENNHLFNLEQNIQLGRVNNSQNNSIRIRPQVNNNMDNRIQQDGNLQLFGEEEMD